MAERVASITLPQNRPDEDDQLASTARSTTAGPNMKPNGASVTGNDGVDDNAGTETVNDAEDLNAVKPSQVASASPTPSPTKDNASVVTIDSRPQYNFSKKDKENYLRFISQAHAAMRNKSTLVLKEDKDIIALTQMVSQMTHLLAASGVGKDTTAQALAYLNGPDKLAPKAALIEAERDRRKKNEKRVNTGAVKSAGNVDGATETKSRATGSNANSDQDTMVSDPKTTSDITTASVSGENTISDAAATNGSGSKTESTGEVRAVETNAAQTVTSDGTGKADKPKKRFGRPNWTWKSRRRNGDKTKGKAGEKSGSKTDVAEDQLAARAIDSKKETTLSTEEQKDNSTTAAVVTTQVAPAA